MAVKNKVAVRTKEGDFTARELMEIGICPKRALYLMDNPVSFKTFKDFLDHEKSRKLDNTIKKHLIEFKEKLIEKATNSEKDFREYLDLCGIPHQFQYVYHYNNGKNYFFLDFYIEINKRRIAIEIDGGYHDTKEQQEKDNKRDSILEKDGVEVFRITNKSVRSTMEVLSFIHHCGLINSFDLKTLMDFKRESFVKDFKPKKKRKSYKLDIKDWEKIPKHQREYVFKKEWLKNMSHIFLFEEKHDHFRINNKGTYYLYYPNLDHLIVERTGTLKGKGMQYLLYRFNKRVK